MRFDDYVLMICEHEEFSLFVSIVDHSLAHGRRQLEPFGLAGWVTLQGIAEAFLISMFLQALFTISSQSGSPPGMK